MACNYPPINIGCFGHCDNIVLPFNATQTGIHILYFDFAGTTVKSYFEGVQGEKIVFDNPFNETSCTTFQIVNPDGTQFYGTGLIEETCNCETKGIEHYQCEFFNVKIEFQKVL